MSSTEKLGNNFAFVDYFNIHRRFFRQQIIRDESSKQVCCEVVNGTVPCVLNLTDILEFIVYVSMMERLLSIILS